MGHFRLALVLAAAAAAPSLADGPPPAELLGTTAPATTAAPSTTAPPSSPDHSPVSVVTTAIKELEDALKKSNKQWFNAIVAFAGGVLLTFFSEKALEFVIMAVAAVIVCNLGMVEVAHFWHEDVTTFAAGPLRLVIGIEFGLLGAILARYGKDAIMVMIAVFAGFTLSDHVEGYLKMTLRSPPSRWIEVCIYSVVTIVFILTVIPPGKGRCWGSARGVAEPAPPQTEGAAGAPPTPRRRGASPAPPPPPPVALYVHVLVILGPFIGAPLIMSSFWYFVTLVLHDHDTAMPSWWEFLSQLWSPSGSDVGLLSGEVPAIEGIGYDRLVGYVGWLVLFIAGVIYQNRGRRCQRRRRTDQPEEVPTNGSGPRSPSKVAVVVGEASASKAAPDPAPFSNEPSAATEEGRGDAALRQPLLPPETTTIRNGADGS